MNKTSFALVLSGVALLTLAACDSMPDQTADQIETHNAHYWQRTDASSAVYQRGPKAQQMLHRDIAKCVYEVRELQRLGAIRTATPGDVDINGHVPDTSTPQGRLAAQDTPERDGYLFTEQADFHDFETCMKTAGWDRVQYLPYNIADEARANYITTMKEEQRRTKSGVAEEETKPTPSQYDNLNQ